MARGLLTLLVLLVTNAATQGAAPVKVDVYFETLCPDSIRFFKDQLTAAVSAIEEIMTVELTAYGFATATPSGDGYKFECQHGADECYGNKIVACTKKYITSEKTFLDFTLCLMDDGSYPPINGKMCAEKMGFKWDPIKECVDSVEGQQLLYQEGVKQNRLSPAVDYIPWIIINDVFSRANLDEAQVDLIGLVCNTYTGTPPNGCK